MTDTTTLSPEEIARGLAEEICAADICVGGPCQCIDAIASAIAEAEIRGAEKRAKLSDWEASANAEIVSEVRRWTNKITGSNCTFADDDIKVLAIIARWALLNGVPDEIAPIIIPNAKRYLERAREAPGSAEASTPIDGAEG